MSRYTHPFAIYLRIKQDGLINILCPKKHDSFQGAAQENRPTFTDFPEQSDKNQSGPESTQ